MTMEKLNPESVDTKGLIKITGFCRQRLHVFRKDPKLGFPEPLVIGRSLRWLRSDISQWLVAMKRSNADLFESLVSKKVTVGLKPSIQILAPKSEPRTLFLRKSPQTTLAEVQIENQQVLSTRLELGQSRVGTELETQDGGSIMRYRLVNRGAVEKAPLAVAVPIHRKILFPPGTPLDVKARRIAEFERSHIGPTGIAAKGTPSAPLANELPNPPLAVRPTREVSLAALRTDYESGQNLDALCKQYRMGKSRLSKVLREAGAKMRQPGRRPPATQPPHSVT